MSDLRTQSLIHRYEKNIYGREMSYFNAQKDAEEAVKKNMDTVFLGRQSNIYGFDGEGHISQDILDALNFHETELEYINYHRLEAREEYFVMRGVQFTRAQIAEIPLERCETFMAKDNVLAFENGKYYQFRGSDSNIHKMACSANQLLMPYSEKLKHGVDEQSNDLGRLFQMMSRPGTMIREFYSREDIAKALENVGITEGFFTVKVGDKSCEYFYSNSEHLFMESKEKYDNNYTGITKYGTMTMQNYCDPGDTIIVDGQEFTLREDHTLDIPYGIDLYTIIYPEKAVNRMWGRV